MFTIRNIGGVALFLFGTTYLWITPMFASEGISTRGVLWSITNVLAFLTLIGFTIATWGLFKKAGWWDNVAIASAVLGLVAFDTVLDCGPQQWRGHSLVHRTHSCHRGGGSLCATPHPTAEQLGERSRDGRKVT